MVVRCPSLRLGEGRCAGAARGPVPRRLPPGRCSPLLAARALVSAATRRAVAVFRWCRAVAAVVTSISNSRSAAETLAATSAAAAETALASDAAARDVSWAVASAAASTAAATRSGGVTGLVLGAGRGRIRDDLRSQGGGLCHLGRSRVGAQLHGSRSPDGATGDDQRGLGRGERACLPGLRGRTRQPSRQQRQRRQRSGPRPRQHPRLRTPSRRQPPRRRRPRAASYPSVSVRGVGGVKGAPGSGLWLWWVPVMIAITSDFR